MIAHHTKADILVWPLPQDPLSVQFPVALLHRRPGNTVCNFVQAPGFFNSVGSTRC